MLADEQILTAQNTALAQAQSAQASLVEVQRKLAAAEAAAKVQAQIQARAQQLEEQFSASKATNAILTSSMSQVSAQATAMQQDRLPTAQALEKLKQEQVQQQAALAAERQADEAKRVAASSALFAQQEEAKVMTEAAA